MKKRSKGATVRTIMSRKLVTVDERERLGVCRSYMRLSGIRHLVVLRKGALVGVISERDIYAAAANHGVTAAWNMRVGELMRTELQTVSPSDSIAAAARRMASSKVGCLPVVSDGELVGIVTTIDVLRERAAERSV